MLFCYSLMSYQWINVGKHNLSSRKYSWSKPMEDRLLNRTVQSNSFSNSFIELEASDIHVYSVGQSIYKITQTRQVSDTLHRYLCVQCNYFGCPFSNIDIVNSRSHRTNAESHLHRTLRYTNEQNKPLEYYNRILFGNSVNIFRFLENFTFKFIWKWLERKD